ncbi:MAG: rhodanese family protein [Sneathiellaceae bacterium]
MTSDQTTVDMQRPRTVDARTLETWLHSGRAMLVDIREADEYAREHIPGARHVPLSGFNAGDFDGQHDMVGVFHCASGNRTAQAADRLMQTAFREVYLLQGGLQAWRSAGLPVNVNRKAPLPLIRQVMIAAGTMVAAGVLLGLLVSPWFLVLSGFVGTGLAFAGITGFCGMTRILALMPWNRIDAVAPAGGPAGAGTGAA